MSVNDKRSLLMLQIFEQACGLEPTIDRLLEAIVKNDTNYDLRNMYTYLLLAFAKVYGWECGIRCDIENPDWPVITFKLPNNGGEISWHVEQAGYEYDGHTTPEKFKRIKKYLRKNRNN